METDGEKYTFNDLKKLAATALAATMSWETSATIIGFLNGAGMSIFDNIMMFKDLPEIIASLGLIKDAFGQLLSNPSTISLIFGEMWKSVLEKGRQLNPLSTTHVDYKTYNKMFGTFFIIGYIVLEIIDPVFSGIASIISKAASYANEAIKTSKFVKAVAVKVGPYFDQTLDIMRAGGKTLEGLKLKAAVKLSDTAQNMRYFGSSGAATVAAKVAKQAGEDISKSIYKGIAKSLKKINPGIRNKLDGITFNGNKVSDTINNLVSKNPHLLDNIGNVKMDKIADILTTAQSNNIKWNKKQIKSLLEYGQNYHYANSGPLKYIEDLADVDGINGVVHTWGTNVIERGNI